MVSGGSRETYVFVMAGRGVQGYTWLVEVAKEKQVSVKAGRVVQSYAWLMEVAKGNT